VVVEVDQEPTTPPENLVDLVVVLDGLQEVEQVVLVTPLPHHLLKVILVVAAAARLLTTLLVVAVVPVVLVRQELEVNKDMVA
tara:strand:- start:137 stop:385 length:249 start_codon:yes stop_codon:yes gene_type:complete